MKRRLFLLGVVATSASTSVIAAPAIVSSTSIMKLWTPKPKVIWASDQALWSPKMMELSISELRYLFDAAMADSSSLSMFHQKWRVKLQDVDWKSENMSAFFHEESVRMLNISGS